MKSKPYKAKTLSGAQTFVRMLLKQREHTERWIEQLDRERRLLARLASDNPQFDNPLHVYEAKEIRDRILAQDRKVAP